MNAVAKGVRWVCSLTHPRSWTRGLTIVLRAYLDDAGENTGEPVVAVAGFVASCKTWERFEELWAAFLTDFGIQLRFHSTTYWCARRMVEAGGDGVRPFKGWPVARFLACEERICGIFAELKLTGIGTAVHIPTFQAWRSQLPVFTRDDPLYYALDRSLYQLIRGIWEPVDEDVPSTWMKIRRPVPRA